MIRLLRLFLIVSLVLPAVASQCGYPGAAGQKIRSTLDTCFADNVVESRVRMAIGFEFCFGVNFQILNDTVAFPYNKKIRETTQQLINLSASMCSTNDDALEQFVFTQNFGAKGNGEEVANPKDTSPAALRKCLQFFAKLQTSVAHENFEFEYILRQNEGLLTQMYPKPEDRQKIFAIVLNVVQPLVMCVGPMEDLKTELVKKYLRQYLAALVNPARASFDDNTYDILINPEFYSLHSLDTTGIFKGKRGLYDMGPFPGPQGQKPEQRTVHLNLQPPETLTPEEKEKVLAMDKASPTEDPMARDSAVANAVQSGSLTATQVLGMTPRQKLDARLINPIEFRKQVLAERGHFSQEGDLSDFVQLKKDAHEDLDLKKLRGFNVQQNIAQLFSI